MADIVLAYVERLAARERLDLDGCGEFLVLVASLLELKARELFPDEEVDLSELDPEEAAEELARRLEEYRRHQGGRRLALRAARARVRPLLPARAGAAAPRGRSAGSRPAGPGDSPRDAGARRRAAPALARAHGSPLPADRALPRAVPGDAAPPARRSCSTRSSTGCRGSSRRPRSWRCSSCGKGERDPARAGRAVRADKGFAPRRRKEHRVEHRPFRLITSSPLDGLAQDARGAARRRLARRSAWPSWPRRPTTTRRASSRRSSCWPTGSARGGAGSCSSTSRAATRSAPRARRPRRARGSSSGRSSARLSQAALETLAVVAYLGPVLAGRRSRALRGVAADSVVAGLVERGLIAEAGREPGVGGAVRYRDDGALRAGLRAREPLGAAAAGRPRRRRGGDPRSARGGRRAARRAEPRRSSR